MFGKITIFTSGNKSTIEQIDKKQTRNFAETIRAKISKLSDNNKTNNQTSNPVQDDIISKLERLAKLKESGIISDEEFEIQKRKILN